MRPLLALLGLALLCATVAASPGWFHRRGGNWPGGGSSYFNPFGGGMGGVKDNEEYYKLLGVPKDSTETEIRRAYRRLAVKMHPDKGGDEAKFKELSTAYEVLTSPEKRKVYDMYGKAGLEGGMPGGGRTMDAEDMANMFGGHWFNNMFQNQRRGPRRAGNLIVNVEVTLEELFNGTSRTLKLQKRKVVEKRMVIEVKPIEVLIGKGMQGGQKVVIPGEVDDPMGGAPGDVIVNVCEVRHPIFTRRNADLLLEMRISLAEALTGFETSFKHLDGRTVWIKSRKGAVTAPGSVWALDRQGMPIRGENDRRGRLFVRFLVDFPATLNLSPEEAEALRKVLRGGPSSPSPSPSSSSTVKDKKGTPTDLKAKEQGPPVLELRKVDLRTFGMSGAFYGQGPDQDDDAGEDEDTDEDGDNWDEDDDEEEEEEDWDEEDDEEEEEEEEDDEPLSWDEVDDDEDKDEDNDNWEEDDGDEDEDENDLTIKADLTIEWSMGPGSEHVQCSQQ